jgi:ABC-type branched-subunit amino acid transport system permease subunit
MRRPAAVIWVPLLIFCVLIAAGFALPGWLRFIGVIALAKGLVVLSLMLLMRAGLVSFGQGLYYGLGAYGAGLGVNLLKVNEALALLGLGIVASGVTAWVLGFLLTRYREIFFAMLSLAFSMILYGLLVKSSALGSTDGFNLLTPTFLGFAFEGTAARQAMFVLTAGVAVAAALLLHRYLGSTRGYLGEAIRENEIRVEYLGASVRGALHVKYVVSAALAGAGGALTAIATGHIDPDLAYWTTSGEFVFVAILSGTGSVAAPFLGSFVFEMIRTYAFAYSPNTWQMVVGGTMLLVIIFMPGGLWSLFRRRAGTATPS